MTLGVEAQFYLILPALLFIVLVGLGKRRRLIKWLTLTLAVLSAVLMAVMYNPANLNRVYYGTDTRVFPVTGGVVSDGVAAKHLRAIWPHREDDPKRGGQIAS